MREYGGFSEILERLQDRWDRIADFFDNRYVRKPIGAILVVFGLSGLVLASFGGIIYLWFFHEPASSLSDPSHQSTVAVPSHVQSPDQALPSPFAGVPWLDQVSAVRLRDESNVVNFAWLHDGSAQYASDFSMPFDSKYGWQKALSAPGIQNVSFGSTLTSVRFTAGRADYDVNLYQPFVIGNDTSAVYMFALGEQGQVVLYRTGTLTHIPLDQVQAQLAYPVQPNPDLTLTKGR